jgi:hypothetical protein
VREERRKQPDRRMNGIEEAEWLEMPEPSEIAMAGTQK